MARKRDIKTIPYGPERRKAQKNQRLARIDQETIGNKITLTIYEVAYVLGIGEQTAYRMHERGELPTFKIGRRVFCSRTALEAWVAEKAMKAAKERQATAV